MAALPVPITPPTQGSRRRGIPSYALEMRALAEATRGNEGEGYLPPEDTLRTLRLVETAKASAAEGGAWLPFSAKL